MQLDSRGYPHIAWFEEKEGKNEVSYSFWDGAKWSYKGTVTVYISEEEINPSPNALILNDQDNPLIVFSRRLGTGSRLSIASYNEGWQFNELDVDYDVGWIGIVKRKEDYNSSSSSSAAESSSSSSGSGFAGNYYVVTYDVTNSELKVYAVGDTWLLIGSISESTNSYSTLEVTICDFKIAIAYIEDNTSIEYNFFDIVTQTWSFASFTTLAASALYGDIIDMDLAGYETAGVEEFCIGWLSGDSYFSYVNSAICLSDGTVTPADLSDYNVEVNRVDVISSSTDYLINSYKKIGVTLDDSGLVQMVCLGVSSKIFSLSALNVWSDDLIDLEAVGNGNVFTYLDVHYVDGVNVAFVADSGDIYYFEPSNDITFPVANPEIILLHKEDYAYRITSFYPPAGTDILDLYDNYYARVLRDARVPLLISQNRSMP
jgi:hypothetical protein